MAHYAKVLNGKVINVIVAEAEFFENFVDDSPGVWIQTSYNTHGGKHYTENDDGTYTESVDQSKALRKNYAGIGMLYDGIGFYEEKLFDSWSFNEETYKWEAPIPYPTDGLSYYWDEETTQWVETLFEE